MESYMFRLVKTSIIKFVF